MNSKTFQIRACVISARKAKQLDATTMFTYSDANTPLGQSERAYYLNYFINVNLIALPICQNTLTTYINYVCLFAITDFLLKSEGSSLFTAAVTSKATMPGFCLANPDRAKIDVKYICSYCDLLLREAMQTSCGHFYCHSCLENLLP